MLSIYTLKTSSYVSLFVYFAPPDMLMFSIDCLVIPQFSKKTFRYPLTNYGKLYTYRSIKFIVTLVMFFGSIDSNRLIHIGTKVLNSSQS